MGKLNNKIIKTLLVVIILIGSSITNANANTNSEEKENILYISSSSSVHGSTQDRIQGINDSLSGKYEIYYEYMNTFKYPEKEFEEYFYSMLSYKLKVYPKFDMVVFVDDSASSFGLKHRELFGDSKIVLSSVLDDRIIAAADDMGIDYVIEEFKPIEANVNVIGDIYKKVKRQRTLTLITGPEDIYKNEIEEFYVLQDKYPNLNFKNKCINFKSEEEIKEDFSGFYRGEDILFFYIPNSSQNSKLGANESTSIVSIKQILRCIEGVTEAPIFTTTLPGVENGMIGGYVNDFYKEGKITVEIIKDFIEGTDKYESIIEGKETSTLVFNQREMTNNLISKMQLPKDAKIVYESQRFFNFYKTEFKLLFAAFAILCVVIIFLKIEREIFKKANKKLQESKDIAEQANKAKSNLMANISHELRTPVNVISSAAQLIKRNIEIKEEINKENLISNIDMIEKNSSRLIRLINNIIDITKSDTGFKKVHLENIEIISLLEDTVLSVIPFAKNKNLNIILDTQVEELAMAIDVDKIERIVLNLLSNAIKFSYKQGNIFVDINVDEDNLIISVKDEGIGIKEELLSEIFDKFVQIDNGFTRLNEGSGIGLSLVRSFVKLHDGSVDVKSKESEGTTFIVKLPIRIIDSLDVIYKTNIDGKNTILELSDIYI